MNDKGRYHSVVWVAEAVDLPRPAGNKLRKFRPFPVSPTGKGRGGRETPTPQKRAAPPTRGFSKRLAKNPLVILQERLMS